MSQRMHRHGPVEEKPNGGPMVALRVMAGGLGVILLGAAFGPGPAVIAGLAIVIVIVALAMQKH